MRIYMNQVFEKRININWVLLNEDSINVVFMDGDAHKLGTHR